MNDEHSLLGASGAARWMACPGSIRETKKLPQAERDYTSSYADEGTAMHAVAEAILRGEKVPAEAKGKLGLYKVTKERLAHVRVYTDDVMADVERTGGELYVEARVFPVPGRVDMFGTGDALIVQPFGELIVNDFKFGAGVTVEVEENDQAKYYALGALRQFPDCDPITVKISQPRVEHEEGPVRSRTFTAAELLEWGDTLAAAAELTADPDAPLRDGDHCRWCPAKARCPKLRTAVLEQAELDFDALPDPNAVEPAEALAHIDLTDPEVLERMGRLVPLMEFLAKETRSAINTSLQIGGHVPGWKLAQGRRGNRTWNDADDAERRLRNKRGVKVDDIYKKVLNTPKQIEAAVGKKWVEKHTHRPAGKLTLVPDDSPKEAVAAPAAFDALPDPDGVDEPSDIF